MKKVQKTNNLYYFFKEFLAAAAAAAAKFEVGLTEEDFLLTILPGFEDTVFEFEFDFDETLVVVLFVVETLLFPSEFEEDN